MTGRIYRPVGNLPVLVTFSGPITEPENWSENFTVVEVGGDGSNLCGSYSYSAAEYTVTCTPSSALSLCLEYRVTISGLTDSMGLSVAAAESVFEAGGVRGDFNADGFADVFIGNLQRNGVGIVTLYLGAASNMSTSGISMIGSEANGKLGDALASHGDFNGDCIGDAIAGAPYYNGSGLDRAYLFLGGTSVGGSLTANSILGEGGGTDSFGFALAFGDFNGDDFDDIIVGAQLADSGSGKTYVYYGSAGADTSLDLTLTSGASNSFGTAVATGDFNGDGYSDTMVTAQGDASEPGNRPNSKAYIFMGSEGGLSAVAAQTMSGTNGTGYGLGAAAGDVNGDGYDDAMVGATSTDSDNGAIHIYYGSANGMSPTAGTTISGSGGQKLGYRLTSADFNSDGYDDILASDMSSNAVITNAYIFFGSAAGANTTAGANFAGDLYVTPVSYDDVNGDGIDDVVLIRYVSNLEEYLDIFFGSADLNGSPQADISIFFWGGGAVADVSL